MEIKTTIIRTLEADIDPEAVGMDAFNGFDVEEDILLPIVSSINEQLQSDTSYEFSIEELPKEIKKQLYDIAFKTYLEELKTFYEDYDFSDLEDRVSY